MLQIEKILVPVDFSTRSSVAAEHAAVMADRFGSQLILAHVIQPLPFSAIGFGAGHVAGAELYPEAQVRGAIEQQMDSLAAQVKTKAEIEKLILEGDPAEKIAEAVKEKSVGLVMMPTHGYGPFRRLLLGSVTAKVLHDVACPVFTGAHVPEIPTAKQEGYRHVACAIDLQEHSETLLAWAHNFAQSWDAKLSVVHAAPAYYEQEWTRESRVDSATKKIDALTTSIGCTASVEVDAQEVVPYVTETARRIGADVLVIGRTPADGTRPTLRPNAYPLVRAAPCAVVSA